MKCKFCNSEMNHFVSFSAEGNFEGYKCPVCGKQSIRLPINLDEEDDIKVKQNKYIHKRRGK